MKLAKKVFFIALMIWGIYCIEIYAATGTVKTEGARIRAEANTSSEVIEVVYEGEEVEVIEKDDTWYKVKYKDKTGYMREDLINVNGEVKEITPAQEENTENENKEEPQKEKEEEKEEPETEKEKTVNPLGDKKIVQNNSVRILPSLSSSVIGEVKEGDVVTVIKVLNSWSYIKFKNDKKAWIPTRFLKEIENSEAPENKPVEQLPEPAEPTTKTGYINVSAAVIREKPDKSSEPIGETYMNKSVEILGEDGDWYKILYNGKEAYIAKRLVSNEPIRESSRGGNVTRTIPEEDVETKSASELAEMISAEDSSKQSEIVKEENNGNKQNKSSETEEKATQPEKKEEVKQEASVAAPSSKGSEVVATAKKYLGCSYVYGGSGPSSFDCSGFTMYVFKQFGVSLAHGAVSQSNAGTYVSKDNLQPGDLVIFKDWDNKSIGHCGIYIGGGKFIHAANPKRGVVTDTLNSGYYYERYVTARRLV